MSILAFCYSLLGHHIEHNIPIHWLDEARDCRYKTTVSLVIVYINSRVVSTRPQENLLITVRVQRKISGSGRESQFTDPLKQIWSMDFAHLDLQKHKTISKVKALLNQKSRFCLFVCIVVLLRVR